MINLKQHNEIIQKLLKQCQEKDSTIKFLQKQFNNQPVQTPKIQLSKKEIQLQKSITQLHKQHKIRVNQLNNQLSSKSNEIKQLKNAMALKKQIQAKEKDHLNQLFRKNFDRKASTPNDQKIGALIQHYEGQLKKKRNQIDLLKNQLEDSKLIPKQIQVKDLIQENIPITSQGISLTKHSKQIEKIQNEVKKYKKLYEQKQNALKDLNKKYSQLTNQYYKMINEYGGQSIADNINKQKSSSNSKIVSSNSTMKDMIHPTNKQNPLQHLLSQITESEQNFQTHYSKLGKSFQTNLNIVENKTDQNLQPNSELQSQILCRIAQVLELSSITDIVDHLVSQKSQMNELQSYIKITKKIQAIMYRIGLGRVPKTQIILNLQNLEVRINRMGDSSDLLDQLCIEVGAKKDKLRQKIVDLKNINQQYYNNMKNLKFVRELPKTNKVVQFIDYFELSAQQLTLPEQLLKIYQQLKSVDKFLKESQSIINLQDMKGQNMQTKLEMILRFLQKITTYSKNKNLQH